MKTLSLSRPLLLLLVGLPGAGKSFFGRQFSEMFGAPMISYNRIQFELFDKPELNNNEQDLIRRLANYQMDELVKTKRSFVIDGGTSSQAERLKLAQFAKKNGYDALIVWVQTDDATCRARATKRNPKRSEEDALTASISPQQWDATVKRFTPPTREPYMVISGKHAFSTQAKMVLRKLSTPHAAAAETAHHQQLPEDRQVAERPKPVAPQRPNATPVRRNVIIS
ncbi:MAG TPA: AAA family ATPase [Candidatus Saccharimonas sp.]|nr:AAA family ATPase [Candidatus Saccharimonas sp.]